MIRKLTKTVLTRLLKAAGLARAAEVEHERRAAETVRAGERERASRAAVAAAARLETVDGKLRRAHERLADEHSQRETLLGMLRHYLGRLTRTEAELAGRLAAERRVKIAQLAIGARAARRRKVSAAAAARVAHLSSVSPHYASAAAQWRAGGVPPDVRQATIGGLQWSMPSHLAPDTSPPPHVVESSWLPMQNLTAIRQFAVGGVMLDIGAEIGRSSIPRVILGDFVRAYAAEADARLYQCLVGNTLDNHVEGKVLPDRVAISGAVPDGSADIPCLTVDQWIDRLGVPPEDVRFVRVATQRWDVPRVLEGASRLLTRRQIVWQIELSSPAADAPDGAADALSAFLTSHFTHLKEMGSASGSQWHSAAESGAVLAALARDRRAPNLLLFNLRGSSTRPRREAAPAADTEGAPGSDAVISLLHCTARLPDGWKPAMEAFLSKARNPGKVEYILAIDEDQDFALPTEAMTAWGRCALAKDGVTGPAAGFNAAARIARGDILITVADDYFPPDGWDDLIRRAVPDVNQEVVLDVDNSDGSTWLLPFSLLTRQYYERYGYIFYPGYHGLCADNEFTEQARRDGVVRSARHIVFEHRHADRGLAAMDDIYARQKSHYAAGEKLFMERQAKGFPKWPA